MVILVLFLLLQSLQESIKGEWGFKGVGCLFLFILQMGEIGERGVGVYAFRKV